MALSRLTKVHLRSTSILLKLIHTGTIGEDNIIRGDKDLEIPVVDLFTFFKKRFETHGEKVALVEAVNGTQMTYNQLLSHSKKVASFLDKKGYAEGDCVGIHLPNCIDYQVAKFGTLANGMVFTTVNPEYTVHEIKNQLKRSNTRLLFTKSILIETARKAAENTNTDTLVSIDETAINDSGVVHLCDILNHGNENFEKELSIDPLNDIAAHLYSSGTTGLPKGVMLTHHNFVSNILQMYEALIIGKNVLCILPMYHAYAILVPNFVHLWHGATVYSLPRFDPYTFLSAIQNYKIENLPLVPPLALFILNHPMVNDYDLSSVKTVILSATRVEKDVTKAFRKKFPGSNPLQAYGMTEGLLSYIQPAEVTRQKSGSTGFCMKHIDVKVRCTGTGKALGPNETGELCTRGPQVMKGYLNNPEATVETIDQDGWLHSGDLGYYDEEGNIFVVDRLKELIKYKGFQVSPAELEETLLSHDDIAESCVIGIPDERAGQIPRAYVIKVEGSSLTEVEVKSIIRQRLSPHKQLRGGVQFVDVLPKSASGKLLRKVLLQEYLEIHT